MAIQRRVNWLSQARVDVPDMRAIESAVSNDFDQLIQGLVTGTSQGYIIRGFNILMANAIGNAASSLLMQVDPGSVMHIKASESGTILNVPSGTSSQQLNAATNTNVIGAFTPNSINYVTIDYTRYIDPSTSAQVYIWDPSTNTETTKIAPRGQILNFVINISTTAPADNQLPVAAVETDGSNLVKNITDIRWMLCSLGTGGLTPNPSYSYPWSQGRTINPIKSNSNSIDPFSGGDKSIGSLKELLNAMMTTFKEIKGTPYWFTGSSTASFPSLYQNAALNILNGGTWVYTALGKLQLKGISKISRLGFTNSLTLSAIGSITSTESLTAKVTSYTTVTFTAPAATTIAVGDTLTIGATTLDINTIDSQSKVYVDEPGFSNGTGLSATLDHYSSLDLSANQVLYILFPEDDLPITYGFGDDATNPVLPKAVSSIGSSTLTVATGGNYVTSGGYILAHGQKFSYTSYNSGSGVFSGVSPDPASVVLSGDYVYQLDDNIGTGYYHYSGVTVVPGIDSNGVSLGAERVKWLAFYDGSSAMFLQGEKLNVGDSIAVGDTISTSILSYIGMPNQTINIPTYTSNIRGVDNENLTSRLGYLTDAIGDSQEDRSAYLRSDSVVSWDGSTLTFTSPIVLEITNTKTGTVTTHTIAAGTISLADGSSAWVLIDRTLSEPSLTVNIDPINAIPAQAQDKKDVFVLFKRHDVSGAGYLHLPFIKQLIKPGQSVMLGASGSGDGGGTDGDFGLDSLIYNASFADTFDILPNITGTAVNSTITNASYSVTGQYYTISYDATRTLTGVGTSMTLSGTPQGFTVAVGDVILFNNEARKIITINNPPTSTSLVIESAFSINPSNSACTVSQAVHTVDVNNYNNNGTELSISQVYSDSIADLVINYNDASSGSIPDVTSNAKVSFSASASGVPSDYTKINSRGSLTATKPVVSLPTANTSLYLRFFASPSLTLFNTVNLLNYEVFFHNSTSTVKNGFALNQSYCFTDSSTTPINCNQPTVVSSKTRVTGLPGYTMGINPGTTNGQLEVFINGQKIPRYVAGSTSPSDSFYNEIAIDTIELDSDYSGYNYSVEVVRPANVIDIGSQAMNLMNPVGTVLTYAGSSPPTGYLLCQGQTLNLTTNPEYSALYNVIATTYGGTGPNNFNLPDLRGRTAIGSGTGSGLTARTLAQKGGSETMLNHSHSAGNIVAQMATVGAIGGNTSLAVRTKFVSTSSWTANQAYDFQGSNSQTPTMTNGIPTQGESATVTQSLTDTNMSPFLALNYIIRY